MIFLKLIMDDNLNRRHDRSLPDFYLFLDVLRLSCIGTYAYQDPFILEKGITPGWICLSQVSVVDIESHRDA